MTLTRSAILSLLPWLAAAAPAPSLRIDAAAYDLRSGVLHLDFTFTNPGDSAAYLDCQVPPRARLSGGTLSLIFDRRPGGDGDPLAGGPAPTDSAPAAAFDAESYPPQRIAGGQTYQGRRRLDRVLGDPAARPKFSQVKIAMAYFPERSEGEGTMHIAERGILLSAPPHAVARKGKPPVPPKPIRIRRPGP